MRVLKDVSYSEGISECLLDAYLPSLDKFPVLVYFHGGGFVEGDKGIDGARLAHYLVPRGFGVVSLNYRMYPNAKYPEFIEDCAEGVRWVTDNIGDAATGIFICGTSAGGYASMMLCFNDRFLHSAGVCADKIKGYIHDAGQPTVHFNVLKERGVDPRSVVIDEAAPLYYIGQAHEYPPMLFIWSDDDIPCRHEQLSLTVSTIKNFGYDMERVETVLRHGTHVHYVNAPVGAEDFELSSIIYPFLEKYAK